MATLPTDGLLPQLSSRQAYFDFLDGYAVQSGDELYERRLTGALAKSYMLETVPDDHAQVDVPGTLSASGIGVEPVGGDDRLFLVHDRTLGGIVGLLELLTNRHSVFYTLLSADAADPWVKRNVDMNPWLDRLWLSAPIFHTLWQHVQAANSASRFTRLRFEYEARYDLDVPDLKVEDDTPEAESTEIDEEDMMPVDRRSSVFSMSERIGTVRALLPGLQESYRPLASLVQLRVPAAGRSGHDFYFNGKVTNRSDSFVDHRQNVIFVSDLYRRLTDGTERHLWVSAEDSLTADGGFRLVGAPLYLQFRDPLTSATFDRWLKATFGRRPNPFRMMGYVFRLGETKAHISAIDRHLWQPIMVEATSKHLVAILPRGTCGNTVHRLITNVQRYLDPGVQAWLGDQEYAAAIQAASPSVGAR